jgi:hypothetical protein
VFSRLKELNEKAIEGCLTEAERTEMVRLTDRMEEFEATRLAALAKIAKIRGQTLSELLDDLQSGGRLSRRE